MNQGCQPKKKNKKQSNQFLGTVWIEFWPETYSCNDSLFLLFWTETCFLESKPTPQSPFKKCWEFATSPEDSVSRGLPVKFLRDEH